MQSNNNTQEEKSITKFSEYIASRNCDLDKAGDGYDSLSELSKSVIDYAFKKYCGWQAKQPQPAGALQWVKDIELMADNFKSHYALEENAYRKAIDAVVEYLSNKLNQQP